MNFDAAGFDNFFWADLILEKLTLEQIPRFSGTQGPSGGTVRSSAMHAVVTWCEALNGSASLDNALTELVSGLGAEAGVIVRTQISEQRPVRIAMCDLARSGNISPLNRTFADAYFGSLILGARPATIWQARAHADDATGDPSLAVWQATRRMKEFLTLILSTGPHTRDHIELHFRDFLSPECETTIATMLPDMVRVWASRRVGMITRSIINHRPSDTPGFPGGTRVRILNPDNPLRLSRSEFRVCLMLSRGLMVQAVANELSLSEATIRTHLRNIYSKTDCGSLAELVFRLIDGRAVPQSNLFKSA